jgi:hypothetical protein
MQSIGSRKNNFETNGLLTMRGVVVVRTASCFPKPGALVMEVGQILRSLLSGPPCHAQDSVVYFAFVSEVHAC